MQRGNFVGREDIRDRSWRCRCPLLANVRSQCGQTNLFFFGSCAPPLDDSSLIPCIAILASPECAPPFIAALAFVFDVGDSESFPPELQLSAPSWPSRPPAPPRDD